MSGLLVAQAPKVSAAAMAVALVMDRFMSLALSQVRRN
jgi:hypothetical protein